MCVIVHCCWLLSWRLVGRLQASHERRGGCSVLLKRANCLVLTEYDFQWGSDSLADVSSWASFCICARLGVQRSEPPTQNPCTHSSARSDDHVPLTSVPVSQHRKEGAPPSRRPRSLLPTRTQRGRVQSEPQRASADGLLWETAATFDLRLCKSHFTSNSTVDWQRPVSSVW